MKRTDNMFQQFLQEVQKEQPNLLKEDVEHLTEFAKFLDSLPVPDRIQIIFSVEVFIDLFSRPGGSNTLMAVRWVTALLEALRGAIPGSSAGEHLNVLINAPYPESKQ